MTRNPITTVDVFAQRRYAGNQLAVVRHAADISDDEMQAIARETNFSETTFVLRDEPEASGAFRVRIFTPREEVPFAGHPTLGTAFVILEDILRGKASEVTLDLKVGPIRVTRDGDVLWMRQVAPTFTATKHDPREIAAILGLRADEISAATPIEDVSTGLPHVIVPLAGPDTVARVKLDAAKYWAWCERTPGAKSILVFARVAPGRLKVRVFPLYYGIAEDPATGSANGCLAGYLAKHTRASVDERVEQGAEVGRPSVLHLRARGSEIDVGGRVQRVWSGALD